MDQRLKLHALLLEICNNVYFQRPENLMMKYPAIVYKRSDRFTQYANNSPYRHKKRYSVTVIVDDPDSDLPDRVAELPLTSFERHFSADNLNHDVYALYY